MRYLQTSQPSTWAEEAEQPVSEEYYLIKRQLEDLATDYFKPYTRQWANPPIRFFNLKEKWEAETALLSSVTEIAMHPSYQQIIGMGPCAIPLILWEMRKKQGLWFWALKSITGEDPVPAEHRGRVKEMTKDWLQWGEEQRYL
jgi:hypothetical protein